MTPFVTAGAGFLAAVRSILHDHVFCFCAIVVCLIVQLAFGR